MYQNGLQRQKFIKSMQTCTKKLEIFNLKGDIDYRIKNIIDFDNKVKIYIQKKILLELLIITFHLITIKAIKS